MKVHTVLQSWAAFQNGDSAVEVRNITHPVPLTPLAPCSVPWLRSERSVFIYPRICAAFPLYNREIFLCARVSIKSIKEVQISQQLGPVGRGQGVKVKSGSEVAQSCPTLSDPMDCSLPGSSIHGTFQARVLEWGAIAFLR